MSKRTIPAISIIIPLYNTEKYIGECLDSILAQTFDDYEVIVVDDCSTDNSVKIVESYIPKFNDKLQLIRSEVNSGGAGTPRNIGLRMSRGEYIFFMDSDDAIIKYAMKVCYETAINFNADVVHIDDCYRMPEDTSNKNQSVSIKPIRRTSTPVNAPTVLSEDLAERVKMFTEFRFRFEPWNHFIKRDFIMKENLEFSNLCIADDMLFGFFLICLAKKIVAIPNLIYIWRERKNSNSAENILDPERCIHRKAGDVLRSIKYIEEFTNNIEFFKNQPIYKYAVFDFFAQWAGAVPVIELYSKVPAYKLDEFVRRELKQIGDSTALSAYLFSRMNVFNVTLLRQQNLMRQQQAQIQQLQAQIQQSQTAFKLNEDIFKLS